jgi:hypothetical protein
VTRLSDVDTDFNYQGEYQGEVMNARGLCRCLGLQIVARGSGKFIAVAYPGGLPGTGWDRQHKTELAGSQQHGELRLSAPGWDIAVDGTRVQVESEYGKGALRKVRRQSATLGLPPHPRAIVLYDGTSTASFRGGKINEEGLLEKGTEFNRAFRDFTMHIEFRLPYMPDARGQGRSNSGVYLQSRYEVQVLDSFGLGGAANECGSLYRYRRPDINMCLPPLAWQTYDITFRSPEFDSQGHKIRHARLTVHHNGVIVHNDVQVERKTGAGRTETTELLPIKLQDHGNPVHFRNIWLVELDKARDVRPVCCCQGAP